jgi:DNA-binding SARP family transcriptional activator
LPVSTVGLVSVARLPPDVAAEGAAVTRFDGGSFGGHLRFEVLGRLRVIDGHDRGGDEGVGLRLGGARQQLVLAMLLTEANSVVSTDALVDGLWGDSPPSAARHTVQGYVSELRKRLGSVVEREGPGYVVRVDDSAHPDNPHTDLDDPSRTSAT